MQSTQYLYNYNKWHKKSKQYKKTSTHNKSENVCSVSTQRHAHGCSMSNNFYNLISSTLKFEVKPTYSYEHLAIKPLGLHVAVI